MWDKPEDRTIASFIIVCIAVIIALAYYWLADLASQIVAAVDAASRSVVP